MAREKKPSWWKMFANRRDIIDSIPDEDVGSGLKAAFAYFDDEKVNESELSQLAKIVFNGVFRPYIDEEKKIMRIVLKTENAVQLSRTEGKFSPPKRP